MCSSWKIVEGRNMIKKARNVFLAFKMIFRFQMNIGFNLFRSLKPKYCKTIGYSKIRKLVNGMKWHTMA